MSRIDRSPRSKRVRAGWRPSDSVEALEPRALLTVAITGIDRLSSAGLLNASIRDSLPLVPQLDGSLAGSGETFVGYPYSGVQIGGTGLEIRFASSNPSTIGSRPAVVQVNWGDATPDTQKSFNPTFQSVYRTATGGALDWTDALTLPHIYGAEGTYQVRVVVSQVPLPDGTGASASVATIAMRVGHVIQGGQGLFLRGTTGNDQVDVTAAGPGQVSVNASFLGSAVTTTSDRVYVDLLDGNDRLTTDSAVTSTLWVDAGSGDDYVQGGSANDHLLGGPGADHLLGVGGADELVGAAGDDLLEGGDGNDTLDGGTGNDQLIGGNDADLLLGGAGDDDLQGNAGDDLLLGGLGRDALSGGEGDDVLLGGYASTVGPNFPVAQIRTAWVARDAKAVARILRQPVVQGPINLFNVPFAILANGRTSTPFMHFGPTLANDAARDTLDGGTGTDLVAPSLVKNRGDNDVVIRTNGNPTVVPQTSAPIHTINQAVPFTAYVSSNGLDIVSNPTRNTILLYRTQPDGVNLFRALPFSGIPSTQFAAFYGRYKPAQLTVDNVTDFAKFANPLDVYWTGFNRPFMAYATGFGSVIETSSDPFDPKNLFNEQTAADSAFHKELIYLTRASVTELYPSPYPAYVYDPMRRLFYQPDGQAE